MTRQQTKELLPIITAFAEGKTIQYYDTIVKVWRDATTPLFERVLEHPAFNNDQYRIKTEPREFWLIANKRWPTLYNVWTTNPQDEKNFDQDSYNIIHVKEVLPE